MMELMLENRKDGKWMTVAHDVKRRVLVFGVFEASCSITTERAKYTDVRQ
jgi:hypothetical protein